MAAPTPAALAAKARTLPPVRPSRGQYIGRVITMGPSEDHRNVNGVLLTVCGTRRINWTAPGAFIAEHADVFTEERLVLAGTVAASGLLTVDSARTVAVGEWESRVVGLILDCYGKPLPHPAADAARRAAITSLVHEAVLLAAKAARREERRRYRRKLAKRLQMATPVVAVAS